MAAVDLHHQHLQRRWAQEQGLVEQRRQRLLVAAGRAAEALRERWPMVQGVWCLVRRWMPAPFGATLIWM